MNVYQGQDTNIPYTFTPTVVGPSFLYPDDLTSTLGARMLEATYTFENTDLKKFLRETCCGTFECCPINLPATSTYPPYSDQNDKYSFTFDGRDLRDNYCSRNDTHTVVHAKQSDRMDVTACASHNLTARGVFVMHSSLGFDTYNYNGVTTRTSFTDDEGNEIPYEYRGMEITDDAIYRISRCPTLRDFQSRRCHAQVWPPPLYGYETNGYENVVIGSRTLESDYLSYQFGITGSIIRWELTALGSSVREFDLYRIDNFYSLSISDFPLRRQDFPSLEEEFPEVVFYPPSPSPPPIMWPTTCKDDPLEFIAAAGFTCELLFTGIGQDCSYEIEVNVFGYIKPYFYQICPILCSIKETCDSQCTAYIENDCPQL